MIGGVWDKNRKEMKKIKMEIHVGSGPGLLG
jgi:hypothetical protein